MHLQQHAATKRASVVQYQHLAHPRRCRAPHATRSLTIVRQHQAFPGRKATLSTSDEKYLLASCALKVLRETAAGQVTKHNKNGRMEASSTLSMISVTNGRYKRCRASTCNNRLLFHTCITTGLSQVFDPNTSTQNTYNVWPLKRTTTMLGP